MTHMTSLLGSQHYSAPVLLQHLVMPRVDVWDVQRAKDLPPINLGYPDLHGRFRLGAVLGKGEARCTDDSTASNHKDYCSLLLHADKLIRMQLPDVHAGGFGTVRVATDKQSGEVLACKSICKRLDIPNLSAERQVTCLEGAYAFGHTKSCQHSFR